MVVGWNLATPGDHPAGLAAIGGGDSTTPASLTITTERRGVHHVMRAAILGPSRQPQMVSFIVDTGASEIVLPRSMMGRLGFQAADLEDAEIQTANGRVRAKRAVLQSVELGGPDNNDVIEKVAAVFIDDAATGGYALMGMNVLGRYSITIEDSEDRILLVRRR